MFGFILLKHKSFKIYYVNKIYLNKTTFQIEFIFNLTCFNINNSYIRILITYKQLPYNIKL